MTCDSRWIETWTFLHKLKQIKKLQKRTTK